MSADSTSLDATTTPSRNERQTPVACRSEAATRACNEWAWVIGRVSAAALALRHSAALGGRHDRARDRDRTPRSGARTGGRRPRRGAARRRIPDTRLRRARSASVTAARHSESRRVPHGATRRATASPSRLRRYGVARPWRLRRCRGPWLRPHLSAGASLPAVPSTCARPRRRVESERVGERCGARIENRSDGRGGPEGVCRPPLAQGAGSPLVHRRFTRRSQLRFEKRGRHQMPVEAGEHG